MGKCTCTLIKKFKSAINGLSWLKQRADSKKILKNKSTVDRRTNTDR